MTEFKELTMEEIESVWGNANFGDISKLNVSKIGLLKVASGYHQGYTSQSILYSLGLIDTDSKEPQLTERGRKQLWEYFNMNIH
jgi:hypothetical protein